MLKPCNLLLFGCDFFPTAKTSEINFWNDMVNRLSGRLGKVVILSVNNRAIREEQLAENIYLYNVRPYYFGNSPMQQADPEYSGSPFHKLPWAVAYKTYSFIKYLPVFDDLIARHHIDIVHYMRVFGLFNKWLVGRHPEQFFTITVPTHIDRGFPAHYLYHWIKNEGLRPMDRVIATSVATKNRLCKLGMNAAKLEVIPWSSSLESDDVSAAPDIKVRLGIPPTAQIVLWSGPLQHTGDKEFFYALDIAVQVTRHTDRYIFIFAFKPNKLKPEHCQAIPAEVAVKLLETDRQTFIALQAAAALFLSPICNHNRTVAPPLTWIEMMQRGIPVMTTAIDGVAELIIHGQNGFIIDDVETATEALLTVNRDGLEQMRQACQSVVQTRYALDEIVTRYVAMWENGRQMKQARQNH